MISKQLYFLTVDSKLTEGARTERVQGSPFYAGSLKLLKNFEEIWFWGYKLNLYISSERYVTF